MIGVIEKDDATIFTFENVTPEEKRLMREIYAVMNGEKVNSSEKTSSEKAKPKANPFARFKCNQKSGRNTESEQGLPEFLGELILGLEEQEAGR